MRRDFTYIDDIVEGLVRVHDRPAFGNSAWSGDDPDPASSTAPYRIYNIGNHSPTDLLEMIAILERSLGKKAVMNMLPMQAGDILSTFADVEHLSNDVGFEPATSLEVGLTNFVRWYREYHNA